MTTTHFTSLDEIAIHLRETLENKKFALLFAYNATGKTRLSMEFKKVAKEAGAPDTLYFNAFTEDLFIWDNDLANDIHRELRLNTASRFFLGLEELEIETRVRGFLTRYTDFNFRIDTRKIGDETITCVSFEREVLINEKLTNLKINKAILNQFF